MLQSKAEQRERHGSGYRQKQEEEQQEPPRTRHAYKERESGLSSEDIFSAEKVVKPWNELPKEVREAKSSQIFKRKLKSHTERADLVR